MEKLDEIIDQNIQKFGQNREALLPILQSVVEENNHLTNKDIGTIAKSLDLSSAYVYGTASFYSFLDLEERGKYVIRICKTISCYMKGKNEILETIEDVLRIKIGETTSDKKFSLLETNCIGWCHKAPAMLINDEPYTELTPQKVIKILNELMHENS